MTLLRLSSSSGQINQSGLLTLITRLLDQTVVPIGVNGEGFCEREDGDLLCNPLSFVVCIGCQPGRVL